MKSCRIELGIAPLSTQEVERVLAAVRKAWQSPSWVKRQDCSGAWLLTIRHEATPKAGESPVWLAEKLAAAIWHAIGRYAQITIDMEASQKDEPILLVFDEHDYPRILRDFRLSNIHI